MLVRRFLIALLALSCCSWLHGQILTNGSLEGPPGVTQTPDGWFSCKTTSTVDIQPGLWGVNRAPQDGNAYIDMVCRGNFNLNMNTCEELSQSLNQSMEAGKCYRLELYLSYFSDFAIPNFRNPIDLRISAGVNDCSRDLELAYYTAIDHDDWRKYTTYFTPTEDLNSIWLEAEYTQLPTYFGHMLIDNLSIEEVVNPPVREMTLCENSSLRLTPFDTENVTSYAWSNGANSAEIDITEEGTYSVNLEIGDCVITETFEVTLQLDVVPELSIDTNICLGDEVILDATTENASYQWQDGSSAPTFTVTEPGNYTVSITVGDCISSVNITIVEDQCDPVLEMPNAFTPNQDGKNDLFTPIRVENIASLQTAIYNRWGENIFTSNKLMIEWDGQLPNGDSAPSTTYYWRLTYIATSGESGEMKGTVSLIR